MTDATLTSGFSSDDAALLAELCGQRADTYALYARLYRSEVDEALLDQMAGSLYPVSSGNERTDEGNRLMAVQLSNLWESTVAELGVDYARTFIGHGFDSFSAAYPFESVHTSEKRLMMQDARDEVRAIYLSEGIQKTEDWAEGEDHIALELEFMATLCRRCAQALGEGDAQRALELLRTQQNFLDDHLASWVPLMTEQMRSYSQTDFYQALSYLTEGLLESDGEFLGELAEENGL